jgi:hypothetical protein
MELPQGVNFNNISRSTHCLKVIKNIYGGKESGRTWFEYFNSTATLLRPSKKSKVEQLSSITIGYIATIKGSNDPIIWKSMRILPDSGCAGTLINQNLVKTLKTTKENRTKSTTKAGNFKLTGITHRCKQSPVRS